MDVPHPQYNLNMDPISSVTEGFESTPETVWASVYKECCRYLGKVLMLWKQRWTLSFTSLWLKADHLQGRDGWKGGWDLTLLPRLKNDPPSSSITSPKQTKLELFMIFV